MMVANTPAYEERGMTLGSLLTVCDTSRAVSDEDKKVVVTGLALKSQDVKSGDLFFACHGSQSSGHKYIQQAIKHGAVAVLYEESYDFSGQTNHVPLIAILDLRKKLGSFADFFYGNPSRLLNVIGVTGTNGKSSCAHFIAHTLSKGGLIPCGLMGTLGNGLYGNLSASLNTTPDALSVHRLLHKISDEGAKNLVMEVSSHGLQQGRANNVKFNTAVFTNLTRDHLDYHGSMKAYLEAKLKLFQEPSLEFAVINMADASADKVLACLSKTVSVVGYRLHEENTATYPSVPTLHVQMIEAVLVQSAVDGLAAKISSPWGTGILRSNLLGRFNIENLLATLGVLLINKIPLNEALIRLETVPALTGRMEAFRNQTGKAMVVIDYAHTPDALSQALQALRSHTTGRLWCVFGCGGDRDKGKRAEMGEIAGALADHVLITNDNPRSEKPEKIIDDITAGLDSKYTVIQDRALAIKFAIEHAAINDVVLISGKGHETYQEQDGVRQYFSDRNEVAKNLDCQAHSL
ncbi:UDP-N-acetylmuramoylalanyl-D-glutamate--2,6-diaminopimelate ligase [hydrothermal vent metagenome]|uniref:UDP-N-acetylmuramoylalanyl-D-glutamate--2,6-diaminopimelate ligase n=1 Tax=hydrothermal vent metagenome TaxID=652676 RepID=A0A3B0Z4F0_9ZZZZ